MVQQVEIGILALTLFTVINAGYMLFVFIFIHKLKRERDEDKILLQKLSKDIINMQRVLNTHLDTILDSLLKRK